MAAAAAAAAGAEGAVVVDSGSVCAPGSKGTCQDSCFVGREGGLWVAAVFDGHGMLGEVAAEVARDTLAAELAAYAQAPAGDSLLAQLVGAATAEAREAVMQQLFARLDEVVVATHARAPPQTEYKLGVPGLKGNTFELVPPTAELPFTCYRHKAQRRVLVPLDYGATAVLGVLLPGGLLIVANAGDASAFLCQCDCEGAPDGLTVDECSVAHTVRDPAEVERIRGAAPPGQVQFSDDGYFYVDRPVLKQHHITPSRSLGHAILQNYGLCSLPHVHMQQLDPVHAFALVLCSDGVTDELAAINLLHHVAEAETAQLACKHIVDDALQSSRLRGYSDDTTVVCLCFQ